MSDPLSDPGAGPAPSRPSRPIVRRRSSRRWLAPVVVLALLLVVVAGIGFSQHWFGGSPNGSGGCPTGVTLQGDGANFIAALAATWTNVYNTESGNTVNYVAGGAGTGITDLSQTTIDFAATDDPLSPAQRASMPAPVLTLPVTGGALAIVYNVPGVPAGLHLSGAVLAQIYLGSVTHWNDPAIASNNSGVALPSDTIQTVHRSDAAGTTFVLTDYLSQDSPAWSAGPGKGISVSFPAAPVQSAIKGNAALLSYVQSTADTIGYVDLTDVLTASSVGSYAAMSNPSGAFIVPTLNNTASAIADRSAVTTFPAATGDWWNVSMVNAAGSSDYPLATFAYFFVFQAADRGLAPSLEKSQVLVGWLDWVLGAGQGYAPGLDYTALTPAMVALDVAGLGTMTYNGAAIPSCG